MMILIEKHKSFVINNPHLGCEENTHFLLSLFIYYVYIVQLKYGSNLCSCSSSSVLSVHFCFIVPFWTACAFSEAVC